MKPLLPLVVIAVAGAVANKQNIPMPSSFFDVWFMIVLLAVSVCSPFSRQNKTSSPAEVFLFFGLSLL